MPTATTTNHLIITMKKVLRLRLFFLLLLRLSTIYTNYYLYHLYHLYYLYCLYYLYYCSTICTCYWNYNKAARSQLGVRVRAAASTQAEGPMPRVQPSTTRRAKCTWGHHGPFRPRLLVAERIPWCFRGQLLSLDAKGISAGHAWNSDDEWSSTMFSGQMTTMVKPNLVGSFNPYEKY